MPPDSGMARFKLGFGIPRTGCFVVGPRRQGQWFNESPEMLRVKNPSPERARADQETPVAARVQDVQGWRKAASHLPSRTRIALTSTGFPGPDASCKAGGKHR